MHYSYKWVAWILAWFAVTDTDIFHFKLLGTWHIIIRTIATSYTLEWLLGYYDSNIQQYKMERRQKHSEKIIKCYFMRTSLSLAVKYRNIIHLLLFSFAKTLAWVRATFCVPFVWLWFYFCWYWIWWIICLCYHRICTCIKALLMRGRLCVWCAYHWINSINSTDHHLLEMRSILKKLEHIGRKAVWEGSCPDSLLAFNLTFLFEEYYCQQCYKSNYVEYYLCTAVRCWTQIQGHIWSE